MTESPSKQSEKSFSTQTIRVPHDLLKRIKHHAIETGQSFQAMMMESIERTLTASENSGGEDLTQEEQALLDAAAEIFRVKPTQLYTSLKSNMEVATNEFRRQQTKSKAAGKGPEHHRRKTGT